MIWLLIQAAFGCEVITAENAFIDGAVVQNATVRVEDGVITHTGDGAPTDGCEAVSTPWLTPGLVASGTELGLVEVGAEEATRTGRGRPSEVAVSGSIGDAYNPFSTLIPLARTGGLTHSVIHGGGAFLPAQSAVVRLTGDSQASSVEVRGVGVKVGGGMGDLVGKLDALNVLFALPEPGINPDDLAGVSPADMRIISDIRRRRIPLVFTVNRASELEALARWTTERGVRVIVFGGAEAWRVAEDLATADIAVAVDPMVYGPGGFGQLQGRADNAVLLQAAGVQLIIEAGSSHNARNLRFNAGNAVRAGLSEADALRAITETPAQVFGVDAGVIRKGAPAHLALWSASPLEPMGRLTSLRIAGVETLTPTRQDLLFERYREPGNPIKPVALPE